MTNFRPIDSKGNTLEKGFYYHKEHLTVYYFTGKYTKYSSRPICLGFNGEVPISDDVIWTNFIPIKDPYAFANHLKHQALFMESELESKLRQNPTESIHETTVPFSMITFSEEPTRKPAEEMEEYVANPDFPFDDPERYGYRPKENSDDLPI